MSHVSSALSAASSTPWWAVPVATLTGVLITVAATITLEFLRAKRDRNTRLFDARRETYASVADLVRRQMSVLKEGYLAFTKGDGIADIKEARDVHREAAIHASLIGSSELVDAIDYQYQCALEAWTAMRRSRSDDGSLPSGTLISTVDTLVQKAEEQALYVINVLRQDTGVPGPLRHQWF